MIAKAIDRGLKVKKAYLKLLLCIAIVLVLGSLAVGCNKLDRSGDYDHLVTFNYNYGNLDANCPDQFVGVKDGSLLFIQPGHTNLELKEVKGLYLEGWYLPKLDTDGNPLKDENNFVQLDKKWDFAEDKVTKDITLYANLVKKIKLEYVDRATGEVVDSIESVPGAVRRKPSTPPEKEGYTFMGEYYANQEGTEVFEWPYTFGETDGKVYVDFIEGVWNLVRTPEELKRAISNRRNVYLMNDIDMAGEEWSPSNYAGEINGNTYKISNISVNLKQNIRINEYAGIFKAFTGKTNIHDITFDNVVVTYESGIESFEYSLSLFATTANADVALKNVTVNGQLHYSEETDQLNIDRDGWVAKENPNHPIKIEDCVYNVSVTNHHNDKKENSSN